MVSSTARPLIFMLQPNIKINGVFEGVFPNLLIFEIFLASGHPT